MLADKKLEIVLAAKDITGQAFNRVQGKMDVLARKVFSLQGAFGAAASAAGIGYFVKRQLEVADAIGKTADKLGLQTESLQEYRYAAELSGVAQNTLDMALQRFTRRTAEAVKGTGELKGILEEYNIAVKNSDGTTRSSEDVLRDLADAMAGAESDSERLRIAFKAFDSEGVSLVNMLRDGSAGLEELRRLAREAGVVLENDLVRGSSAALDAVTRASRVIGVQFTRVVADLSPEIEGLALRIGDAGPSIRAFTDDIASAVRIVTGLYDKMVLVNDAFLKYSGLMGLREDVYSYGGRLLDSMGSSKKQVVRLPIPGQTKAPSAGAAAGGAEAATIKAVEEAVKSYYERMKQELYGFHDAALSMSEARRDLELGALEEIGRAEKETRDEIMTRLYAHHDAALAMSEAQRDLYIDSLDEMGDKTKTFSDDMAQAFTGWANDWSKTLNGMLWGAETTFDNILKSFGQMITQMVIQKSVVEPIAEAGSSFFSGIGDFIADLLPFAKGGVVTSPTVFPMGRGAWGLAGEAGTEAILPLTRMPDGDLGVQAATGPASPVYVEIVNNTGQPSQVQESRDARGGRSVQAVIGEVVSGDIRSGGPVHKSIRDVFGSSPSIVRR